MEVQYSGVISRTLSRDERRVPISEEETPLVIEPSESRKAEFLREFLACHSSQICRDIAKHGALLLRGFEVESPPDFERILLSVRGMRGIGMDDVLMSEPGRTEVDGTNCVFYTNTLVRTGGTLQFGMFHTENYFLPDVPRYISFMCEKPSTLGGETGLLNVAKVYSDLPEGLRCRLEERCCLVSLYPLTKISARHGVSLELIETYFQSANLPLATIGTGKYAAIYKPSVIQHPTTRERALLVNFSFLPDLQKLAVGAFRHDYSGSKWFIHRMFWKAPSLGRALFRVAYGRALEDSGAIYVMDLSASALDGSPLAAMFSSDELEFLANTMRHRFSSFLWRRGDILVVDNLKMAHNGMAGHGDRQLKVMMCNPVPLPLSSSGSGMYVVPDTKDPPVGHGTQLRRFALPQSKNSQHLRLWGS